VEFNRLIDLARGVEITIRSNKGSPPSTDITNRAIAAPPTLIELGTFELPSSPSPMLLEDLDSGRNIFDGLFVDVLAKQLQKVR
jgi:hypothetical protein